MEVRTAEIADLDGVLALWRAAGHRRSATDDVASLRALLGHPTATLLVAVRGHLVVGSALPAWDGWRATIYRVVLHPDHEVGDEVGHRLVERSVRWLQRFGVATVGAPVDDTDAARDLWRGAGFRHDEHTLRFVVDVDVAAPVVPVAGTR